MSNIINIANRSLKFIILNVFILILVGCASHSVRFAAVGDTPYYGSDSELERLSETFTQMAAQETSFVIHVGDIFRGSTSCSEKLYESRAAIFNNTPMPLLITIGDNEFNDCQDANQAQVHFRNIILGNPPTEHIIHGKHNSFEPIRVKRQSAMIENASWSLRNVGFVMLTLPDLPGNYPLSLEKIDEILAANTSFLVKAFSTARVNKRDAMVVITHSEPMLCRLAQCKNFNTVLAEQVKHFNKPVLLINGSNHSRIHIDGHYLKIANWSQLRPGNEPEEVWPEIIFSTDKNKFIIKWHDGPSALNID